MKGEFLFTVKENENGDATLERMDLDNTVTIEFESREKADEFENFLTSEEYKTAIKNWRKEVKHE